MAQSDISLANRLAHEVLGRTLDKISPQTRKLLVLIQEMVKGMAERQHCQPAEVHFTRRDIRDALHWSDSQLKNHSLRLVEMEYLLVHGGSRRHLLQYELLYDGAQADGLHLCGLLDVDEHVGSKRKSGAEESKSTPSLPQVWGRESSIRPEPAMSERFASLP